VRLTPKGGRDALDGVTVLSDGRDVVKARVRAAPKDGEANAALLALIAKTLGVAKSDAVLAAGHTARLKTIDIRGDGPALAARLTAALKEDSA
jgi:uncharacterized protein YggU (UPF0235/DUF167 family)